MLSPTDGPAAGGVRRPLWAKPAALGGAVRNGAREEGEEQGASSSSELSGEDAAGSGSGSGSGSDSGSAVNSSSESEGEGVGAPATSRSPQGGAGAGRAGADAAAARPAVPKLKVVMSGVKVTAPGTSPVPGANTGAPAGKPKAKAARKPPVLGPDGKPVPRAKPAPRELGPDGKPVRKPRVRKTPLGPDGKPVPRKRAPKQRKAALGPDGKPVLGLPRQLAQQPAPAPPPFPGVGFPLAGVPFPGMHFGGFPGIQMQMQMQNQLQGQGLHGMQGTQGAMGGLPPGPPGLLHGGGADFFGDGADGFGGEFGGEADEGEEGGEDDDEEEGAQGGGKRRKPNRRRKGASKRSYPDQVLDIIMDSTDKAGCTIHTIRKIMLEVNSGPGGAAPIKVHQHLGIAMKKLTAENQISGQGVRWRLQPNVAQRLKAQRQRAAEEAEEAEWQRKVRAGEVGEAEQVARVQAKEEARLAEEGKRREKTEKMAERARLRRARETAQREREREETAVKAAPRKKKLEEHLGDPIKAAVLKADKAKYAPAVPRDDLRFAHVAPWLLGITEFLFEHCDVLKLHPFTVDMLYDALVSDQVSALLRELHLCLLGLVLEPEMKQAEVVTRWDWFKTLNSLTWQEILRRYVVRAAALLGPDFSAREQLTFAAEHLRNRGYVGLPLESKIMVLQVLVDDVHAHPEVVEAVDAVLRYRDEQDRFKNEAQRADWREVARIKFENKYFLRGEVPPPPGAEDEANAAEAAHAAAEEEQGQGQGDDNGNGNGGRRKKANSSTKPPRGGAKSGASAADEDGAKDKKSEERPKLSNNEAKAALAANDARIAVLDAKREARNKVWEAQMLVTHRLRCESWGQDRQGNEFYSFHCDPARLYVVGKGMRFEETLPTNRWRYYDQVEQVDRLIQVCDEKYSKRERHLKRLLTEHHAAIAAGLIKPESAAGTGTKVPSGRNTPTEATPGAENNNHESVADADAEGKAEQAPAAAAELDASPEPAEADDKMDTQRAEDNEEPVETEAGKETDARKEQPMPAAAADKAPAPADDASDEPAPAEPGKEPAPAPAEVKKEAAAAAAAAAASKQSASKQEPAAASKKEPAAASPAQPNNKTEWQQGDEALAFDFSGGFETLYRVKVVELKEVPGGYQYLVHYRGWSNAHDAWVPELLPTTPANIARLTAMQAKVKALRRAQALQKANKEKEQKAPPPSEPEVVELSMVERMRPRRGAAQPAQAQAQATTAGPTTRSRDSAEPQKDPKKTRLWRVRRVKRKKTWRDDDPQAFLQWQNLFNYSEGLEMDLDNPTPEMQGSGLDDPDVKLYRDAERMSVALRVLCKDLCALGKLLNDRGGALEGGETLQVFEGRVKALLEDKAALPTKKDYQAVAPARMSMDALEALLPRCGEPLRAGETTAHIRRGSRLGEQPRHEAELKIESVAVPVPVRKEMRAFCLQLERLAADAIFAQRRLNVTRENERRARVRLEQLRKHEEEEQREQAALERAQRNTERRTAAAAKRKKELAKFSGKKVKKGGKKRRGSRSSARKSDKRARKDEEDALYTSSGRRAKKVNYNESARVVDSESDDSAGSYDSGESSEEEDDEDDEDDEEPQQQEQEQEQELDVKAVQAPLVAHYTGPVNEDIDVGKDEAKRIELLQRFENLFRTGLRVRCEARSSPAARADASAATTEPAGSAASAGAAAPAAEPTPAPVAEPAPTPAPAPAAEGAEGTAQAAPAQAPAVALADRSLTPDVLMNGTLVRFMPATFDSADAVVDRWLVRMDDGVEIALEEHAMATAAVTFARLEQDNRGNVEDDNGESALAPFSFAQPSQEKAQISRVLWGTTTERDVWVKSADNAVTCAAWAACVYQLANRLYINRSLFPDEAAPNQ
jgi:hypothetical protein